MIDKELQELADFYVGDLPEFRQLKFERHAWFARCQQMGMEIYKRLGIVMAEETVLQAMFPGLHTALVLYMLSATTCEAERSFSMLRRLLTYLRSTQGQDRMSNLALIHCHRDVARTVLQLPVLMKEFVSKNQVRRNMFLDAESEEK